MTDLASVIISIESGGKPHAQRFEYTAFQVWNWSPAMDRIKTKHACSKDTAKQIACTSYGLYQILAINIFDPLIATTYLIDPADNVEYLNDTGMQDRMFNAYLDHHGIKFQLQELLDNPDKMRRFVEKWNGPGNIDQYSALIRSKAAELNTPPAAP